MARQDIGQKVTGFNDYQISGQSFRVPILYRQLDSFFAGYTASAEAVRKLLPSAKLSPVKIWPGRTLALLNAFNYQETDVGPYGEFAVSFPCTVQAEGRSYFGTYIHRLPVTTEIAKVAGIEVWGYPKFVCRMDFAETAVSRSVRLTDTNGLILGLEIGKGGLGADFLTELATFTVRAGKLIYTKITVQSTVRVRLRGEAKVELGGHPMAGELGGLQLSARPLMTGDFFDTNLVLPHGEEIGPA